VGDTHDATRGPIDLVQRYDVLRGELSRFSDELAARPEIVALNKCDLLVGDPLALPAVKKLKKHLDKKGVPLLFLSGAAGVGVDGVLLQLWQRVQAEKAPTASSTTDFDPARALR
jgi:GTP-binding protein